MKKKLKIAIGMKLQDGAFGGGNQFGKAIRDFLVSRNSEVVFSLRDSDIDIILLTETRRGARICAFDAISVAKYLLKKPDTLVVFRVNECDERKSLKTQSLNKLLIKSANVADNVVFISEWLKRLFEVKDNSLKEKDFVIWNGADNNIFNFNGYQEWNGQWPLRIVTHHWGGNLFKGFDVYLQLDKILGEKYKGKIEFTYIGNIPKGINFKNVRVIPPQSGKFLASEIKRHHVYLTASINEPAGMHHIEGALCGLPLLYRNSGALTEYCDGYGISFQGPEDFEQKLEEMIEKYGYWAEKIKNYSNTADKMCQNYYNLFIDIVDHREEVIEKRKLNRIMLRKYIFFMSIFQIYRMLKGKFLVFFRK